MQGRVAGLSPRCHTALPGWLCPVMGDNRAKRLQPEIPEHRPHRQQGQTPAPVPSASTLPAWCRESHVERWFFRLHGRAHTPLHPALPGRLWVLSGFRLLGIRHCGDVIVQARGYTLEGAPWGRTLWGWQGGHSLGLLGPLSSEPGPFAAAQMTRPPRVRASFPWQAGASAPRFKEKAVSSALSPTLTPCPRLQQVLQFDSTCLGEHNPQGRAWSWEGAPLTSHTSGTVGPQNSWTCWVLSVRGTPRE